MDFSQKGETNNGRWWNLKVSQIARTVIKPFCDWHKWQVQLISKRNAYVFVGRHKHTLLDYVVRLRCITKYQRCYLYLLMDVYTIPARKTTEYT